MQEISSDVIIIGAGLTGLTLAYKLRDQNINVCVIEARDRIGGRILTKYHDGAASVEMGATWISSQHTKILALLKELDIQIFEQFMGETAIYEAFSTTPHQLVQLPPSNEASYRVKGGTQQIIEKLARHLDSEHLYLDQAIHSIQSSTDCIAALSETHRFTSKVIVSTLPPMLFINRIATEPALPDLLVQITRRTHTWMGDSIKIALQYRTKFWDDDHLSGTIFSNVGPIPEMYDHSNSENTRFALKGFLNGAYFGVTKEERLALILKQLEKYYGNQVHDFMGYEELVWRNEDFTHVPSTEYILPHMNNGHSVYQQSYLGNRLILAGTETSPLNSGYMEGAINSAMQVYLELAAHLPLH